MYSKCSIRVYFFQAFLPYFAISNYVILFSKLQFTTKFITADQLIQIISIFSTIVVSDKMVKIDLFSISHDYWCIHVYILKVG